MLICITEFNLDDIQMILFFTSDWTAIVHFISRVLSTNYWKVCNAKINICIVLFSLNYF